MPYYAGMDIATLRAPKPPKAGELRLVYEDGYVRAIDPNGRKMRLQVEAGEPNNAVAATVALTVDTQPNANDTLVVGSNSWTFVSGTAGSGQIAIGANLAATQTNIRAAINATSDFTIGTFSVNVATITAAVAGAAGNVRCSITARGNNAMQSATLSGGGDAVVASKGDMMFAAGALYIAASDISKTSASGWWQVGFSEL